MIYLYLLLFTAMGPLLHLRDRRIYFIGNFWALLPAISVTAVYFLAWDYFFTQWGVWGFNPKYLCGIYILNLPLEEVLFFFIVPLACMFIYEVMKYYVPRGLVARWSQILCWVLAPILLAVGLLNLERAYTSVTCLGAATLLAIHVYLRAEYLGRFWLGYGVSLAPFFLVNGILTGSFLSEPIVWYNNSENLGLRMGTIPIEDAVYMLVMLLSTCTIYEETKRRFPAATA